MFNVRHPISVTILVDSFVSLWLISVKVEQWTGVNKVLLTKSCGGLFLGHRIRDLDWPKEERSGGTLDTLKPSLSAHK